MKRPPRSAVLSALVFALPVVAFALYRSTLLPESDLMWQIRTGNVTLATGAVPRVNEWGWLIEGRAWLPNSWLWNVLLAGIFDVGGIFGICALTFVLCCAIFGLAQNLLRQLKVGSQAQFILLVLMGFSLLIWITTRPQEADYILLLAWLNLLPWLAKVAWRIRAAALPAAAFVIAALWMNLHLSATIAIALFPATYWLLDSPASKEHLARKAALALGIAAATTLGALATPFGIGGIIKGSAVAEASRGIVTEWSPIDFTTAGGWLSLVGLVAFGVAPVLLASYRHRWLSATFFLAFAILAEQATRFVPLLILTGLLAAPLLPRRLREARVQSLTLPAFSGAMVLVLSLSAAAPRMLDPASITLLNPADLKVIPAGSRVLTMPEGGGLMLLYRPDLSPSLDGRNDIYGKDLYLAVRDLFYGSNEEQVASFLKQEQVDAVYLPAGERVKLIKPRSTIVPVMEELRWVRHNFSGVIIWVRPGSRMQDSAPMR